MKQVFITGASSGLGKALAEAHLELGDQVHGISRSCSIESDNYKHHQLDLTDLDAAHKFYFDLKPDAEDYLLYNNAGSLGQVKHFGSLTPDSLQSTFSLNTVAPILLSQQFYKAEMKGKQKKFVLHIGSGAGENPIDGWLQYCSSKAGLHMAAKVIQEELKLKNDKRFYQRVLSPGVIDTPMQKEIRESDMQHFSQLERFREYKRTEALKGADETAHKIIRNFNSLFASEEPIQYLKNYQ